MITRTNITKNTRPGVGRLVVGVSAVASLTAIPAVGAAHARAPVDVVQQDASTDDDGDGAPSIEPGDTGELVAWWQDRLNTWLRLSDSPTEPVTVDGDYGPQTQWATLMFQQSIDGVAVDGVVDPEDRVALHDAIEALQSDPGSPSIELGDRNELAAWWQERLNTWIAFADDAPDPLVVDGWFGPNTEAATLAFQERVDVPADGVVDPEDRVALEDRIDELQADGGAPPIELGDRNELAAWWQDRLNTWIALSGASIEPIPVDGWYGPITEEATRFFQDTVDAVPTDGVVDPEDRVALHDAIEAESGNGQNGENGDEGDDGQDGEEQGFSTDTQTSAEFPAIDETRYLEEVVFGSNEPGDRLIFQFDDDTGDLSYEVGYVDAASEPSGDAVVVDGDVVLRIAMSPASGVDLSGDTAEEIYTGPDRFDTATLAHVNEVALAQDFEAMMVWAAGVDAEVPFRVEVMENPLRLVVDLAER